MRIQAAPRWAISFADLGLILLGCFAMLHAIEAARPRATAGSTAAASGALVEFRAADLFEPGEGGRSVTA